MLNDLIRAIDYSDLAEIALVLFCVAFWPYVLRNRSFDQSRCGSVCFHPSPRYTAGSA